MTLGLLILWYQGVFYVATAGWPILSRRTFEAVTGAKNDWWLVKLVSWLLLIAGAVFLVAAWRRAVTLEVGLMSAGFAAALIGIDLRYAIPGRIRRVYLLDAAAEAPIVLGWIWVAISGAG